MKLRVITIVAVQVTGVAVAFGATRIGTFFGPNGATPLMKGPDAKAPTEQAATSVAPATASNAPPARQLRPWPPAWGAFADSELADPWPPHAYATTWDPEPALEIVEPWAHQHVSPAIAIVDPWPEGSTDTSSSVPLATESRAFSLVVDPWRTSKPEPPTKAFPVLPEAR